MSIMPHWLDDVFHASEGDKEAARKEFEKAKRFDAALDEATFAYREKVSQLEENPNMTGSPDQEARSAFLKAIQAN